MSQQTKELKTIICRPVGGLQEDWFPGTIKVSACSVSDMISCTINDELIFSLPKDDIAAIVKLYHSLSDKYK